MILSNTGAVAGGLQVKIGLNFIIGLYIRQSIKVRHSVLDTESIFVSMTNCYLRVFVLTFTFTLFNIFVYFGLVN